MGTSRIKEYIPYEFGFDILEGTIVAHVKYPKKWKVVDLDENSPLKTFLDTPSGRQYYWADSNMDLDIILDAIDETVEFNKDMEARIALLCEKIEELNKLFSEKDLTELQKLEFTFKTDEPVKKTKKTKKKKEEILSDNNEVVEEKLPILETLQTDIEETDNTEVTESLIDEKVANAMKSKRKIGE